MNKLEKAYIAGFFDGEGSIHARFDTYSPAYIHVDLAQKDPSLLQVLAQFFPGHIYENFRSSTYQLTWTGRRAEPFLKAILPYLTCKRVRAILTLKVISLQAGEGKRMTDEDRDLRNWCGEKINQLNRKGHERKELVK